VPGRAGVVCRRTKEEAVCERARTTKVVKGGGEEMQLLVNHRLDDGGIGRGVTTTELQLTNTVGYGGVANTVYIHVLYNVCRRIYSMLLYAYIL
jgi:hypothetical protein